MLEGVAFEVEGVVEDGPWYEQMKESMHCRFQWSRISEEIWRDGEHVESGTEFDVTP